MIEWCRKKSPWVIHFNSGSCNGCDIEVIAALTPKYDVERFGILPQGSPRHADILIATGPVTGQAKDRLIRIHDQMPGPKSVVAIGTCATSGAPFTGSYNTYDGVGKVVPVDLYVAGCPPKPEAIIHGILSLLESQSGTE